MLDKDKMKELAELMEEYKLTEIEYEVGDEKICLKRERVQTVHRNVATGINTVKSDTLPQDEGEVVKAPLVGTFYAAPGEGKEPYVKVGDTVKKGQIIGIIEAMKLMNEIESDVDGVVTEILAQNGKMVEFGQGIIRVK